MFTSLRLKNFKNFADETLKLGPFTVIVGANASGKSNIRDAFRFLHGIGRGHTLAEIFGGKVGGGGETVWERIRGAPIEIARFAPSYPNTWSRFTIDLGLTTQDDVISYSIEVGINVHASQMFRVCEESLQINSEDTFIAEADPTGHPLWVRAKWADTKRYEAQAGLSVLAQTTPHGFWAPSAADYVIPNSSGLVGLTQSLLRARTINLMPEYLRAPADPRFTQLGNHGQNLPSALQLICQDDKRGRVLTEWLSELTPMDVDGFEFPRDSEGMLSVEIVERNGRKVSAQSASDGTLRFLGMLALLLTDDRGQTYFFEDMDNAIHPNRLWLLLDLIERQTARRNIQVITTTHSPALLGWMNDTTFADASVVFRDEDSSDGIIRPVSELPNIRELRETQGLGRLITSGWIEDALSLTTDNEDTAEARG